VEHLIEIRSEQPHLEVNQADNVASNPTPLPPETTADPARVEPTLEQSPLEPLRAKPKQQRSNRQLQRVEILSSAGEWVGGYLVHQGIAVANLAGSEHRFKLFDASGSAYIFWADSPTSVRARLNSTSATKSARPRTEPLVERPLQPFF
jgi:hypothetical protein